jgi:hypothetical protein
METRKYQGKDFSVTIDRNRMERRYILSTIDEDGTWEEQNDPLNSEEFSRHYGFSHEWPYETI